LIKESDRSLAVELIEEAKAAGARIFKACEVLEISSLITGYSLPSSHFAFSFEAAVERLRKE